MPASSLSRFAICPVRSVEPYSRVAIWIDCVMLWICPSSSRILLLSSLSSAAMLFLAFSCFMKASTTETRASRAVFGSSVVQVAVK